MPDPTNPQSFNRYSYTQNNPIRYIDPSGHCIFGLPCPESVQNGIRNVADFGLGVITQFAHDNALTADLQGNLEATPNESTAMTVGRIVGGTISSAQGIAEGIGGAGMMGGGAAVCATGVGCLATPSAEIAGAATIAHGAVVASNGVIGITDNILTLASKGSGGSESRDFQRLSKGEIDILTEAGYHPHGEKPSKGGSRLDIFKDGNGDLYLMPKDGSGPGEPLEININDLWD